MDPTKKRTPSNPNTTRIEILETNKVIQSQRIKTKSDLCEHFSRKGEGQQLKYFFLVKDFNSSNFGIWNQQVLLQRILGKTGLYLSATAKIYFYPKESTIEINSPSFDILKWWKIKLLWFPNLVKSTKTVFMIHMKSINSESAFLTSGWSLVIVEANWIWRLLKHLPVPRMGSLKKLFYSMKTHTMRSILLDCSSSQVLFIYLSNLSTCCKPQPEKKKERRKNTES